MQTGFMPAVYHRLRCFDIASCLVEHAHMKTYEFDIGHQQFATISMPEDATSQQWKVLRQHVKANLRACYVTEGVVREKPTRPSATDPLSSLLSTVMPALTGSMPSPLRTQAALPTAVQTPSHFASPPMPSVQTTDTWIAVQTHPDGSLLWPLNVACVVLEPSNNQSALERAWSLLQSDHVRLIESNYRLLVTNEQERRNRWAYLQLIEHITLLGATDNNNATAPARIPGRLSMRPQALLACISESRSGITYHFTRLQGSPSVVQVLAQEESTYTSFFSYAFFWHQDGQWKPVPIDRQNFRPWPRFFEQEAREFLQNAADNGTAQWSLTNDDVQTYDPRTDHLETA